MSIILNNPMYSILINGVPITNQFVDADIKITMDSSFEPDIFRINIYNINEVIQQIITNGALVNITLGYSAAIIRTLMTGIATKIYRDDTDNDEIIVIEGIDLVTHLLKKKTINLNINIPMDVVEIVRKICISAGVILAPSSIPSGIILSNYTIDDVSAYESVKELAKRVKFNATSKNSLLYFIAKLNNPIPTSSISDGVNIKLTKISGLSNSAENKLEGYSFYGVGLPTLIPLSLATVLKTTEGIIGTYLVESVVHEYNSKTGYLCNGILVEINANEQEVKLTNLPTEKSIVSSIKNLIENSFKNKRTLDTGVVEQLFTVERLLTLKYGLNLYDNKQIITPSLESDISKENVFLTKKPVMSMLAGDGFGIITPIYKEMLAVLGFNKFSSQDANILGFLWRKGWTIPEHDEGEYLIHLKNHSKISMKEDGHGIFQFKGLKIEINSSLTAAKTTATDDGKLTVILGSQEITMDGSSIVLKSGSTITLTSSGADVT